MSRQFTWACDFPGCGERTDNFYSSSFVEVNVCGVGGGKVPEAHFCRRHFFENPVDVMLALYGAVAAQLRGSEDSRKRDEADAIERFVRSFDRAVAEKRLSLPLSLLAAADD